MCNPPNAEIYHLKFMNYGDLKIKTTQGKFQLYFTKFNKYLSTTNINHIIHMRHVTIFIERN